MRFKITGDWDDNFSHDGLLYCVQRMEEMLMAYTSHLYKAPIHNSFSLAYEFLNVYYLVEKKTIDQVHLKNVLEEFISCFENDIVIKEKLDAKQIEFFIGRLKGNSSDDQRRTIHYLIHIMDSYPLWCEEILKQVIKKPKEKKKIEKALRSYISMLIMIGYHPHYIYSKCRKVFTEYNIKSLDVFDSFTSFFDGIDHEYTVYFIVDKRIEKFKEILEDRLIFLFDDDECSCKLRFDNDKQICVHISETALDPNGAAKKAYSHFDLFMRYYQFLGNRDQERIGDRCLVVTESGETVFVYFGAEQYFYSQDYDDITLVKNSEYIITELIEKAGQSDFFKIDKVICRHNIAISSPDINNSFLNLWSIMEIIGVDGFGGETSKIKQIMNNIIPILKRNYINRVIEELHDYLKGNLDASDYANIMNLISEDGEEEYKIACLVSLKKYDEVRKNLCGMLNKYPVIRSRISHLYEDVFKKKRNLLQELNRYGQRLWWHIQRLYRVRNSIIHSGEESENIVPLVEHLHSYVDEIICKIRINGTPAPHERCGSIAPTVR